MFGGEVPVPEIPRHVNVFSSPFRWLGDRYITVVVISEGWELANDARELLP